jgi:hypothetical protein
MGNGLARHSADRCSFDARVADADQAPTSIGDESVITSLSTSYSASADKDLPRSVVFYGTAPESPISESGTLNTVDDTIIAASSLTSWRETVIVHDFSPSSHDPQSMVRKWDGSTFLSDMIRNGLEYLKRDSSNVVMIYESPSSSTNEGSFFNR